MSADDTGDKDSSSTDEGCYAHFVIEQYARDDEQSADRYTVVHLVFSLE